MTKQELIEYIEVMNDIKKYLEKSIILQIMAILTIIQIWNYYQINHQQTNFEKSKIKSPRGTNTSWFVIMKADATECIINNPTTQKKNATQPNWWQNPSSFVFWSHWLV